MRACQHPSLYFLLFILSTDFRRKYLYRIKKKRKSQVELLSSRLFYIIKFRNILIKLRKYIRVTEQTNCEPIIDRNMRFYSIIIYIYIYSKNFFDRIIAIFDMKKIRCAQMTTSAPILIFRQYYQRISGFISSVLNYNNILHKIQKNKQAIFLFKCQKLHSLIQILFFLKNKIIISVFVSNL